MSILLFPVLGVIVVFFVAVPLFSLAASTILAHVPVRKDGVLSHVSPWRFGLIVGPTLGPLIWLISAAVHQSEEDSALVACALDHLGDAACQDVVIFGSLLFSILGVGAVSRVLRGSIRSRTTARGSVSVDGGAERVRQRCAGNTALAPHKSRIIVVGAGLAPACTRGIFFPRVEIESSLVERLGDEELDAVLLHELEHVRARDPLRLFVAQVALAINPTAALLGAELSRYRFARETICDLHAVQHGADPLALAHSIVSVAGSRMPSSVVGLSGHGIGGVRVRVQLLLGYAVRSPVTVRRRAPIDLVFACVIGLAIFPHYLGTGALDLLHLSVERAVLFLGLS